MTDLPRATLVRAAVECARAGFRVHPVGTDKRPQKGWPERATSNPDEAARLFEAWPGRDEDLCLTIVEPENAGVFLLDVDVKSEHNGWTSLQDAGVDTAELRDLAIYAERTPSGGAHLVFSWPEDLSTSSEETRRVICPGVELRFGRNHTLIAPSPDYQPATEDLLFEALAFSDPTPPPADLVRLCRREDVLSSKPPRGVDVLSSKPSNSNLEGSSELSKFVGAPAQNRGPSALSSKRQSWGAEHQGEGIANPVAYFENAFRAELKALEEAPKGDRNNRLNKAAYKLGGLLAGLANASQVSGVAFHWAQLPTISDMISRLSEAAVASGLPMVEARATAESGLKAGIAAPIPVQIARSDASGRSIRVALEASPEEREGDPGSAPSPRPRISLPWEAGALSDPDELAEELEDELDRGAERDARVHCERLRRRISLAHRIDGSPEPYTGDEAVPPHAWLLTPHLARRQVTLTSAPGGVGKSLLVLTECIAMASGRPLLGDRIWSARGPLRVMYYNGEDDQDSVLRRAHAAMRHHGLTGEDLGGRLFLRGANALDGTATQHNPYRIKLATTDPATRRAEVDGTSVEILKRTIRDAAIDVLILDPLASLHEVEENSNGDMETLMNALRDVAHNGDPDNEFTAATPRGVAVEVVHHQSKSGGSRDASAVRGASGLVNAARYVRNLIPMSADDAEELGVPEDEARHIFEVASVKSNLVPRASATWRRRVSVNLENGDDDYPEGDNVPAVEAWSPTPRPGADVVVSLEDDGEEPGAPQEAPQEGRKRKRKGKRRGTAQSSGEPHEVSKRRNAIRVILHQVSIARRILARIVVLTEQRGGAGRARTSQFWPGLDDPDVSSDEEAKIVRLLKIAGVIEDRAVDITWIDEETGEVMEMPFQSLVPALVDPHGESEDQLTLFDEMVAFWRKDPAIAEYS